MGGGSSAATVSVIASGESDSPFATRRCPGYADGVSRNPADCQTMQVFMRKAFREFAGRPFLGVRKRMGDELANEYTFMTYRECEEIAMDLGSAIIRVLGLEPQSLIGVFSENRTEWVHVINESCLFGHVTVGLNEEREMDFVIKHAKLTTIFVSSKNAPKLLNVLSANRHEVINVVLFTESTRSNEYIRDGFAKIGIQFITFDELCEHGKNSRMDGIPDVESDWLHYVSYTSGSGQNKGVLISHRSQVSNVLGAIESLGFGSDTRHLSYLPLGHAFERMAVSTTTVVGGQIGFFSGSIERILEDMQALKPTHMAAVPRVIQRMYDVIMNTMNKSWIVKRKLMWGMWYWKRFWLNRGHEKTFVNRMFFDMMGSEMGGCVRQFIIGGAAMDPWIHEFMQVATGLPVRVGYGLSETGSGNTINPMSARFSKPGTVGGPLPNVEIRLEPLPGYGDPECGEILVGGDCLCSGYLFDESSTKELFADESRTWVKTRDIGKWDRDNYLVIVDRVIAVFTLSHGEYVAAEQLTEEYTQAPIVRQLFAYGDGVRNSLVAVVVVDPAEVARCLECSTITDEELLIACSDSRVIREVRAQLGQIASARKFTGYERIHAVACISDPWTPENGLANSTGKLNRRELARKYRDVIDKLYSLTE